MKNLAIIVLTLLLTAGTGIHPGSAENWSPDKALLGQLAPETSIGEFRIRPPKDSVVQEKPGPNDSMAYAWKGIKRPDGTSPYLMVLLSPVPEGESVPDPDKILQSFMRAVAKNREADWKSTSPETGTINGINFIHAEWEGTDVATGKKMHGFMYVTIEGKDLIQISSQDVEPHHKAALKLAETAALTFHKIEK